MHPRRTILNAIKERLVGEQRFHWVRNTRLRDAPNAVGNMFPGVTFYAVSETVETLTIHHSPNPQDRDLQIAVTVWLRPNSKTPEDYEIEADLEAERLEQVMFNDIPGVDDITLQSTDFDLDDPPDIMTVTLTYRVTYNTTEFL